MDMKDRLKKNSMNLIIIGLVLAVVLFGGWLYFRNFGIGNIVLEKDKNSEEELAGIVDINEVYDGGFGERMYVDLDGDENEEEVKAFVDVDMDGGMDTTLKAYEGDEIIAEFYPGISIMTPMINSFRTHILDKGSNNEYFSFNFIAGTHSSETMFFRLNDNNQIVPVCFKEPIMGPDDCLFFSDAMDSLIVEDINEDGFVEVVETGIERGPYIEELTEEEELAIEEAFTDLSDEEIAEAKEIATSGSNRTGRLIALHIYSFDGDIFKELTVDEYSNMVVLLTKDHENVISRNEAPLTNLEYIEMAKKFWTGR